MSDDRKTTQSQQHTCRTCGKPVSEDAATFPFCHSRCRMADLGKWFNGDYKITREIKDSDIETVD